jgi:pimeloyl-ACP methyl ester carboxylesterase
MSELASIYINGHGIQLHGLSQGHGPLVIFCHGFPGLAYSWRQQMQTVADQGFRALALDMRGYGRSDRPEHFSDYHVDNQIADLERVLDQLGESKAIFVGHDFGANLVWSLASRKPELVAGVVGVSVPFGYALGDNTVKPSEMYAGIAAEHFFHMHYFQALGPADRELSQNSRLFLTRLFWALSAEGNLLNWTQFPSEGTGYLDVLAEPDYPLPWSWLSKQDMDVYVKEYEHAGKQLAFTGGLSSYRVADINWQLEQDYLDSDISVPAAFISGSEDPVLKLMSNNALEIMQQRVPDLRVNCIIEQAGHFVQQEQAAAFNAALLTFLASLKAN